MDMLRVEGLTKHYPAFTLDGISFSVQAGRIMGLIGKNGAGKSTTLKSILRLVHPDAGEIKMFGENYAEHEAACKQSLGVVLGGVDYFPHKKLRQITDVTRRFYQHWDAEAYGRYLEMFALDENKRVKELSTGMKVKYAIALALSHDAKLLIFDEPTSGLDPVARADLLELFRALVKNGERSILYSTHITSDLERCADDITYIKEGKLVCSAEKAAFIRAFDGLKQPGEGPLSLEEIMIRKEGRTYTI